jgi:hypothetical protein
MCVYLPPSHTSTCSHSAPICSQLRASEARWPKSAARMDGITMGAAMLVAAVVAVVASTPIEAVASAVAVAEAVAVVAAAVAGASSVVGAPIMFL